MLRLVNVDADFPSGITWSGALYTDEGWYANNAIAHLLTGDWYIEGGFNNAINVPVLPLCQYLSFLLLGINLFAARVTIIVFFILLEIVLFLLVRKWESTRCALLVILLLSINYVMFAYSRMALVEIPMLFFAVASIFLTSIKSERYGTVFTVLSSLALFVALLTKPTAVFGVPVILYLLW